MRMSATVPAPGDRGHRSASASVFSRAIDSVARRLAGGARLHLPVAGLPTGVGDLVPGRPAVVRLVFGTAAGHRHRRRVARGGLGNR